MPTKTVVRVGERNEAGVAPNTSLWSCKTDGTALHRLTFNLSNDADPAILPDGRIVLNLANEDDLTKLPHVGPTRAKAILADPALAGEKRVPAPYRAGRGVGHVEAPRGTLTGDTAPMTITIAPEARHAIDDSVLMNALELGEERTFEHDPAYAVRLLVDIAIRALSPAVNDPTTAVQALDQIEDLLIRLSRCHLEGRVFRDVEGAVRLMVPSPAWTDLLRLALDEICACGATSVQVMRRMAALLSAVRAAAPEERLPLLPASPHGVGYAGSPAHGLSAHASPVAATQGHPIEM